MTGRTSKRIVLGWACAALAAHVALVARAWPGALVLAMGVGVASAALVALRRRTIGVVVAPTYVLPAAIWLGIGSYHPHFTAVWLAAVLGAMLPDAWRSGWNIPPRWRFPLVLWTLMLVVGLPIVAGREIDFNLALLDRDPMPGSALGGLPPFTVDSMLHAALIQVLGILWFDWLFGAGERIVAVVVPALAAGAAALMGVVLYQRYVQIIFLNETVFGAAGRAGGTVFDANVCGTIAALWIGMAAVPAVRTDGRPRLGAAAYVMAAWLTVLASGSRTALVAAVIVSAGVILALFAHGRRDLHKVVARGAAPAVLLIVAVLLFLGSRNVTVFGPLSRTWNTLPSGATAMTRAFPFVGVGPGAFETILPLFAQGLPPDNQNWVRHVLAELGLVGAAGSLWWAASFAAFVLFPRRPVPVAAWPLGGALVAFGVVSLLGVPGQDLAVSLTGWTIAFWYVSLRGAPAAPARQPWWAGFMTIVLVGVYGVGTLRLAMTDLRPPVRSERTHRPYSYGFYEPELDADGREYRWARRRAVAVIDAPTRWLAITVSVNHADIRERPVTARIWRDRELVIIATLDSGTPITQYVLIPDDRAQVMLETRVDRAERPSDFGVADDRELGLMVRWEFVSERPEGD